jgi:hypothetical protein
MMTDQSSLIRTSRVSLRGVKPPRTILTLAQKGRHKVHRSCYWTNNDSQILDVVLSRRCNL